MATKTITVEKAWLSGSKFFFRLNTGFEKEFSSLEEAKNYIKTIFEDDETLVKLGLARYLAIDPDAKNPLVIEGHSISLTDGLNTMITVI